MQNDTYILQNDTIMVIGSLPNILNFKHQLLKIDHSFKIFFLNIF